MGRGRAKAKQTKELHGEKDSSPDLDPDLDTGLDAGLEADDYDQWSDYSPSRRD